MQYLPHAGFTRQRDHQPGNPDLALVPARDLPGCFLGKTVNQCEYGDAAAPGAMEAMRRFRIADRVIEESVSDLQTVLGEAYQRGIRPLCLMYIAQVGDQYLVKRMPLSGGGHDPSCISYEAPDELSGLGVLMGSAIKLDPESGMAALYNGRNYLSSVKPPSPELSVVGQTAK